MTIRFFNTAASGDNDGTTWANAWETWAALLSTASMVAGDDLYVEKDSSQTAAFGNMVYTGSARENPWHVWRVDDTDDCQRPNR